MSDSGEDHLCAHVKSVICNRGFHVGLAKETVGIPYTLVLKIEAMGFPTFGLLLYYVWSL